MNQNEYGASKNELKTGRLLRDYAGITQGFRADYRTGPASHDQRYRFRGEYLHSLSVGSQRCCETLTKCKSIFIDNIRSSGDFPFTAGVVSEVAKKPISFDNLRGTTAYFPGDGRYR